MARPARRRLVWVLGFLGLTLAVVYAAFGYLFVSFRNQLDRELGLRLVAVASATAAAVNGGVWSGLAAGDSAAVAGVRTELEGVRRDNDVSDIFLFGADETTLLDLGGYYDEGAPNPALSLDVVAVTTALAGIPAYTRLYAGRGAYFRSGYAAVTDSAGEIVGGVGVEASAGFLGVLNQVKDTLAGAAVVVLVGMLLLGAGFARLLAAQEGLETRLRRTETLAAMGQMAAMLAHEIRNPLGIIRGAAERTGERYGIGGDEVFRFIPEEVDRLERTLGAYLDFARPPGTGEVEDLGAALDRTLALIDHEISRKGIAVTVDKEAGDFPVRTDPHYLRQAFLNVALNARDAMPGGGTLEVGLHRRGGRVAVTFADRGPGMSAEVRRRAAEPFYTSKDKGSGLGLTVVARVMEEAGGRLELRDRPGGGTVVEMEFPLEPGESR